MSRSASALSSLLPRLVDHVLEAVEILVAKSCFVHAEHCCDCRSCGVVEERSNEMPHCTPTHPLRVRGWKVHVARALVLMTKVSFLFQQAEHSSHRGVARRIRKILQHFGSGCTPAAEDDLHNLALAASELFKRSGTFHLVASESPCEGNMSVD